MTPEELRELADDCPVLYHMAESGSWSSIRDFGLLSTSRLLDFYGIAGAQRQQIEAHKRPASVVLEAKGRRPAVVRDQRPMDDKGLSRCLRDDLSPSDWYRLLNSKVFFWLTRKRLLGLLNAGAYRSDEHDVLELDSFSLIEAYSDRIWCSPINSGCTKPFPHPRGISTFLRIPEYPYAHWRTRRQRGERVVEIAVDDAVPDVSNYERRVSRMRCGQELGIIYKA